MAQSVNSDNNSELLVPVALVLDNDKTNTGLKQVGTIKVSVGLILSVIGNDQFPNDLSEYLCGSLKDSQIKLLHMFYKNKESFLSNEKYKKIVKLQISAIIDKKEDKLPFYNAVVLKYGDNIEMFYGHGDLFAY